MIKSIKSMKDVKILSSKETMAIRGGVGFCDESHPCPTGWCCNLSTCDSTGHNCTCQKGGPFGGCSNP